MWHYGITQRRCEDNLNLFSLTYANVVHSTWPSHAMWRTQAPKFNKWRQKKKKKTLHMLTHDAMRGCGLTSLVVCINDNFHNLRERNVTIRSDIWTMNIHSLGFWDIRGFVTLWRLILRSSGCTMQGPVLDHIFIWLGSTPPTPPSLPGLPASTRELFLIGSQCHSTRSLTPLSSFGMWRISTN
jgi:hypothetical protein